MRLYYTTQNVLVYSCIFFQDLLKEFLKYIIFSNFPLVYGRVALTSPPPPSVENLIPASALFCTVLGMHFSARPAMELGVV